MFAISFRRICMRFSLFRSDLSFMASFYHGIQSLQGDLHLIGQLNILFCPFPSDAGGKKNK